MKKLYWPNALLVGAESERLSRLFDRHLHFDRTLPLSSREWTAYRLFRNDTQLPSSVRPHFLPEIASLHSGSPTYDLLIHPGAGARNRLWSVEKYPQLLAALPASWRIAFMALPSEITVLQTALSPDRPVDFVPIADSLRSSLAALSSARLLLVMNSGTMHFADVLGIPAVAIFGQQDPSHVIDEGSVEPIYERSVPCQPCGRNTCGQPSVYCLTNLDPIAVAQRLHTRYANLSVTPSAPSVPTLTQIERP
jgi:heptosyltransferase-2